ncbi:MAG TPA: Ppx/GppA phosphatase family protein [Chthonomonadaceae bacterium]|nr:Ppx/GppA phosphatase family protein [Chthonomonadaceae bacterium]
MEVGKNQDTLILAAIDIGTNSIRLAVVRVEEDQRLTTLAQHREVVRLGEGEFETNQMTPDAIARGALVCAKFAEVARGFGAREIVALATSAVREADNREEFIERVRREAGIEVRVISGVEEARLIWLGVSSGMELGDRRAVLVDIGGGSTEIIVGDAAGYRMLESLRLGSIRLSNRFLDFDGPVSSEVFARVQGYVMGVASQVIRRVKAQGFDLALGSAGTINTLGDIVARHIGDPPISSQRNYTFRLSDLQDAVQMLCRLPLEERRKVPGMDANRADIILGGAAIILTLMEGFGAEKLMLSERGLRDGILLDHLLREEEARQRFQALSVRRRSILQLAHACNYEAEHAQHTAHIALRLFDELRRLKAHPYGDAERELLEYAAIAHDIGMFISHSNHQKHAYYLLRNFDLLGFNDTEINIIANVALYHRKGIPKKRHSNLENLDRAERRQISVLAAILRVAEGIDRSHLGLVKDVRMEVAHRPRRFVLTLLSESDCQLEVWGVQNNSDLFEYVFGAPLTVRVEHPAPVPAG